MWRDWDEDVVKEDVNIMKRLDVRIVRIFLKDEDFADEDGNLVGSFSQEIQ
ncbi:MAG: hypothetical protein QXF79_03660 [Ignisphaera sp.]